MPSKRGTRDRSAWRKSVNSWFDRVRSAKRRARSGAARPSASGTRRTRIAKGQAALAPRTVVVGTLCVVAAAALVMSRQSSIVNWVAQVDENGEVQSLERVDSFDPAPSAGTTKNGVSPRPSMRNASPANPEPDVRVVPASLRTTESEAEPAAPLSPAGEQAGVPATIVGCLEREDSTFFLKDVSGDDAPRSRSWKSGFLRKKSPSVQLVGGTNRFAPYVGRRLETTGILNEREMRVKSLRVLGACE